MGGFSSRVGSSLNSAFRSTSNLFSPSTLRNTGTALNSLGSTLWNGARDMSHRYNTLITNSYSDARALQQSSNPFARAVGNYSVGVRDGIANLNRTVDEAGQFWKGVGGPVGRIGEGLVFLGKGFTAPLRAVDHTATNAQRNGAVIESGITLLTGGLGKLAGPALKAVARTPLGKAATQTLGRLGQTQVGQQLARLPQVASWLNNAPGRALLNSNAGRQFLAREAVVRNSLQVLNNFGKTPLRVRITPPGVGTPQVGRASSGLPGVQRQALPSADRGLPTMRSGATRKLEPVVSGSPRSQATQIQSSYFARPGDRLQGTVDSAVARAQASKQTQNVHFNGVHLQINPGDEAAEVLGRYNATGKPNRVPFYDKKPTQIQTVHHARPGEELRTTVRDAVLRATRDRQTQVVVFNGEHLRINPGETAKKVMSQYNATGKPTLVPPKPGDRDVIDLGGISRIDNLSEALASTARREGRIQVAHVNGLTLEVRPGDTARSVLNQYNKGAEALRRQAGGPRPALTEARHREPDFSNIGEAVERATRLANKSGKPFMLNHPGLERPLKIQPGNTAPFNARRVAVAINSRKYPTELGYNTPSHFGYHDYAVGMNRNGKLAIQSVSKAPPGFVPHLSHYYKGYFSPTAAGGIPVRKMTDQGPWRGLGPQTRDIPLKNGNGVLRDTEGALRDYDATHIQTRIDATVGTRIDKAVKNVVSRANSTRQTQNLYFNGVHLQVNPGAVAQDVLQRYARTGKAPRVLAPVGPSQIQYSHNLPTGASVKDVIQDLAREARKSGHTQLLHANGKMVSIHPGTSADQALKEYRRQIAR